MHRAADWFENWHIGRIVTVVSQFGIILAVIAFAIDLSDRTEERTVRAWQLVTTQACGNSGKIAALEYLNEDSRPFESIPTKWWPFKTREPLTGINLSKPDNCEAGTYLFRVDLRNADLSGADLSNVYLKEAKLDGAILLEVNLSGANLEYANLNDAILLGANLSRADLTSVKLGAKDLFGAWAWTGRRPFGLKDLPGPIDFCPIELKAGYRGYSFPGGCLPNPGN